MALNRETTHTTPPGPLSDGLELKAFSNNTANKMKKRPINRLLMINTLMYIAAERRALGSGCP